MGLRNLPSTDFHFSLGIQRTEIKLPRPRDAAPRQLPYDGEGSPPLAEGTAVPSLLESDHGDVGLKI